MLPEETRRRVRDVRLRRRKKPSKGLFCRALEHIKFIPPRGKGTGFLDAHTSHSLSVAGVGGSQALCCLWGTKNHIKRGQMIKERGGADDPCCGVVLYAVGCLAVSLASASRAPRCDNHDCLQTWPSAPSPPPQERGQQNEPHLRTTALKETAGQ